jgi:hypothetical protein
MNKRQLETLPKGWAMQQCAKCEMVFALPPQDDTSGTKGLALVSKELDRHVKHSHPREDFSQAAARIVKEATED